MTGRFPRWADFFRGTQAQHGPKGEVSPPEKWFRALKKARPVAFYLPIFKYRLRLCLLDPEQRLIAYGTLVPGGKYFHLVKDLAGTWQPCVIRGHMGTYRGYKSFKWNPEGPPHSAWLLTSPELPLKLPELDGFEGQAYSRRLIPAQVGSCVIMANIYEGKVVV